jgi:cobalt-zinc-cadmium efflux system outer membrane protein
VIALTVVAIAALLTRIEAVAQSPLAPADLVRRAVHGNRELAAARLDLERGRARLRQAGLRPNPTIDVEQLTGRFTGSPEERDVSVGIALPLELGARRGRRIEVAEAELAATEAEIADRERQLARDVLLAYADALSALREQRITAEIHGLDEQTTRVVKTRVEERDASPLELNLLLTEVDRLRSRQALIQGRLQAALIRLKHLLGVGAAEPLAITEAIGSAATDPVLLPATLDAALDLALRQRPDLRQARLNERVAQAQIRLARAEAAPELTASATFTNSRSENDLPAPLVPVSDHDRVLTFGISVGLPVFNANQGARAEAAVALRQAQMRSEFLEQTVRAEVTNAFRRAEFARDAVTIFEQGVINRSSDNVRVMRAAYELGEFRITDLITEQRRLLDAQREYTDALIERYRAAIDLLAATGTSLGTQP